MTIVEQHSRQKKGESVNTRFSIMSSETNESTYVFLFEIFGDDLPQSFQILWCNDHISLDDIQGYLYRTLAYPQLDFTLIHVNLLNQICQDYLLQFLLKQRHLNNLNFIESGVSILNSLSWLRVVKDADIPRVNMRSRFGLWYYKYETLDPSRNICFIGPAGSGETFHMRKWSSRFSKCCVLSITEEFDISKALTILSNNLKTYDEDFPLRIQVNIGKFRGNEGLRKWKLLMADIDRFIFQLVILRSITSSDSDTVVNIPWGKDLYVALELPDVRSYLDQSDEMNHGLFVMNLIFAFMDTSKLPFEIDCESRHVSKYLKAYESGAINSLYKASSDPKAVLFIMDVSGSMKHRLDTCKRMMDWIFDSKLQPQDSVGLITFDDVIQSNIPLAAFDNNHMSTLKSAINEAQAGRGTNMWSAIQTALQYLSKSKRQHKIMVALTDGDAFDSDLAPQIKAHLAQEGKSVKILFITIGLNPSAENVIRKTCIRDASRDHVIPATDLPSLHTAWVNVGKLLTVSQTIEKLGSAISDDECRRLLRKFMHLDTTHSDWSKTEQIFWIRYMDRRCGILAASEKFNKNKNMPTFEVRQ